MAATEPKNLSNWNTPPPLDPRDLHFWGILRVLLRSLWTYYRLPLVALLFAAILAGLSQIAAPKVVQQLIDLLAVKGLKEPDLLRLAAWGGLFFLGAAGFGFVADKLSFYLATQVEDRWRFIGLHRFFNLPMRWQDHHDSGEIGAKMEQGAVGIFSILYEIFGQAMLVSSITLVMVVIYTFWAYPLFGWILIAPLPFYLLVTGYYSRRISDEQTRINQMYHEAVRTWFDGVGNMRYVKTFGREIAETSFYAGQWAEFHGAEYQNEKLWLTQSLAQKIIETFARVAVLLYGARSVLNGSLSLGELVLLLTFQQLTFAPMELVHRLFTRLRRVAKRVSHLLEIVAEPDPLADSPGARRLSRLTKEIKVENLSFSYDGRNPVLKAINFKVKAGSTTAVVGRSGSGKSTLAMLLLRFYDPDQGRILWDGMDLREASRASLRERATLILQDTSLFNRSIRDNITYGKPGVTRRQVERAARMAHAHDFIRELPKGYDSVVGERGVRLSGGQRQRIAIARALLVDPRLLVMDEATSHLDSETEAAIQEAIAYLRGRHTQVIIAHRLSTVRDADNILLMDRGKLVAQGRHQVLLKDALYRRLCNLQLK